MATAELTCPLQHRYSLITKCHHCDNINIHTFSLSQVPTLLPSWFSVLGRGALSGQRGSSLVGRSLLSGLGSQAEGVRLSGVSWSPPSPSLQDEATIHTVLVEDQEPINLEKVTDDQVTPTLANRTDVAGCSEENDIKAETLEDD